MTTPLSITPSIDVRLVCDEKTGAALEMWVGGRLAASASDPEHPVYAMTVLQVAFSMLNGKSWSCMVGGEEARPVRPSIEPVKQTDHADDHAGMPRVASGEPATFETEEGGGSVV